MNHKLHREGRPSPDWLHMGIIAGIGSAFVLIAALAWYVVAIVQPPQAALETNAQIQSGYLDAVGQRGQAAIHPTSAK